MVRRTRPWRSERRTGPSQSRRRGGRSPGPPGHWPAGLRMLTAGGMRMQGSLWALGERWVVHKSVCGERVMPLENVFQI